MGERVNLSLTKISIAIFFVQKPNDAMKFVGTEKSLDSTDPKQRRPPLGASQLSLEASRPVGDPNTSIIADERSETAKGGQGNFGTNGCGPSGNIWEQDP